MTTSTIATATAARIAAPSRVLSVKEPWATLIVGGYKPIENRSWAPPKGLRLPCRIAIHASGKTPSSDWWMDFAKEYGPVFGGGVPNTLAKSIRPGCIVGSVLLTGVAKPGTGEGLTAAELAWYDGEFGWRLTDVRRYRQPIPASGRLNLWEPDAVLAGKIAAAEQLAESMPLILPAGDRHDPDDDLDPDVLTSYWDAEDQIDYTAKELTLMVDHGEMTAAKADRIRASGPKTDKELFALWDERNAVEDPD